MFPWIHMMFTPNSEMYPCCLLGDMNPFVSNVKEQSFLELTNSKKMKELRLKMLADEPSKYCETCYKSEKYSANSFRTSSFEYESEFENIVSSTNSDGSLDNFKMLYVDVRLSNKCNFKCRMCGSLFSSSWAEENGNEFPIISANKSIVNKIIEQIPNIKVVYFAGGEPLLMNEHFILLEKIIESGRSVDIKLRYNSNMSTIKYKKKNIIDLWNQYKEVQFYASIDHYGSRAEYIRHGTKWQVVCKNIKQLQKLSNINIDYNVTVTNFSFLTLINFIHYMINERLFTKTTNITFTACQNPEHFSPCVLPMSFKNKVKDKFYTEASIWKKEGYYFANNLYSLLDLAYSVDLWKKQKINFLNQVDSRDAIRNENLYNVFPELYGIENQSI